ncbi:hypothetical protein SCHPADRAFT_905439 [Schizopora paradoxa]|uniref:FHA domain-containing protein n=1 Tax=Schizopora paradoxa TaxID=27342 RepID=A0A0H2RJ98_9AGAM|nr:hypothetical protein SCHPADRAFT_905439 [Schizopora paradoxa]
MSSPSNAIDLASNSGPITGIVLSCKEGYMGSEEAKTYILLKDDSPVVHLVRASHPKNSVVSPENPESSGGRVTFTCPVMSRRHARLSFSDQGTVTITDLKSLHGTFRHNPYIRTGAARLSPLVEYSLNHGDIIKLGKEVHRDDRMWSPVEITVELLREREESPVEVQENPVPSSTNERSTPNRYGLYSPTSPASPANVEEDSSSESSSSSDDDDDPDAASHTSYGSDISHIESPSESSEGAGKSGCSLLHLGRLPSLRDLGFRDILRDINSVASRPAHVEPQVSHSYFIPDAEEASLPPAIQYPEIQLGLIDSRSQTDLPSSIPIQGGGSPEPEPDVEADDGAPGSGGSRHSSPMELSSGSVSRESSPSPVGAWPECEPVQRLNISDLSKQVMNALRPVIDLSSKIGASDNGKGKGRAMDEVPPSPALPHPDMCRSDLFLPPILSAPTSYEFDNVWQQESLFVGDHSAGMEIVEQSHPQRKQDNVSTESSLNALSSKIHDLVQNEMVNVKDRIQDRIQDLKESIIPLVERQLLVAKAMITATRANLSSTSPPANAAVDSATATKETAVAGASSEPSSPKQELQDIRDEMLRFSTLLEQVLVKVEAVKEQVPSKAVADTPSTSQIETEGLNLTEGHSPLFEAALDISSRKRKRTEECGSEAQDVDVTAPMIEASSTEASPAKRQRRDNGATVVRGLATAASFTTLGAVATWATLAYYL